MPLQPGEFAPAGRLPDPRRLVPGRGDDVRRVRAEGGGVDTVLMPLQTGQFPPAGRVPDPRTLVPGRGNNASAVWAKLLVSNQLQVIAGALNTSAAASAEIFASKICVLRYPIVAQIRITR